MVRQAGQGLETPGPWLPSLPCHLLSFKGADTVRVLRASFRLPSLPQPHGPGTDSSGSGGRAEPVSSGGLRENGVNERKGRWMEKTTVTMPNPPKASFGEA